MRILLAALATLVLPLAAHAQNPTSSPAEDAEFSVAAVDFVTKNCTGLTIDYQKLSFILKDGAMTEDAAREGALYKRLTTSFWPDAVKDIGMQKACYELQVHFVKDAKGTMRRLMFPQ